MQGDEEEESVPQYFEYDRRSFLVAKKAAAKLKKESDVLNYCLESKPPCLRIADCLLGMDLQSLDKHYLGVAEKLTINGYEDRGNRLKYLWDVLNKKLKDKDVFLQLVAKLLMEFSERPTAVTVLEVQDCVYSELSDASLQSSRPRPKMTAEMLKLAQKQMLKDIFEEEDSDISLPEEKELEFSSQSDLSNWTSDEEPVTEVVGDTKDVPNIGWSGRTSHSLSDFSEIKQLSGKQDLDVKRKEMEDFWNAEAQKSSDLLNSGGIDRVVPLSGQPVIRGLFALQTKFGEYWEWKHGGVKEHKLIIAEDGIIREILWQFSVLSPATSCIFMSDWCVRPGLMTSSLSHSALSSILEPIRQSLKSLNVLKDFVRSIVHLYAEFQNDSSTVLSKILLSYAQGMSEILLLFADMATHLENRIRSQSSQPCCSTLVQMTQKLQTCGDIVKMLNTIQTQLFQSDIDIAGLNVENLRDISIRIMFTLADALDAQTVSFKYEIVMRLFVSCLRTLLSEVNDSFKLDWTENLVYTRFPQLKISEANFWRECIKQRPFQESRKFRTSYQWLSELITEILTVLKTSEMMSQLGEDHTKLIGNLPSPTAVAKDFLAAVHCCPRNTEGKSDAEGGDVLHHPSPTTNCGVHFQYLGMLDSLEAKSMKSTQNYYSKLHSGFEETNPSSLGSKEAVMKIFSPVVSDAPRMNQWDALHCTILKHYGPFYITTKICIHKIFCDYQIDQSLKNFREIILETREDFAQSVITLVDLATKTTDQTSRHCKWGEEYSKNPEFQKLLNDCYPDGRENFEVMLKLDSTLKAKYVFEVIPHFPLNLVLSDDCISGYLFISQQLSRIRESLWKITALNFKDFRRSRNLEPNRILLFKYALLHFCANLRAYFVYKIIGKQQTTGNVDDDTYYNVDQICQVHRKQLKAIQVNLLRTPIIDKVILVHTSSMSELLCKYWTTGFPANIIVSLEDTLKKCWSLILTSRRYGNEFNELAYYFGPIPVHL